LGVGFVCITPLCWKPAGPTPIPLLHPALDTHPFTPTSPCPLQFKRFTKNNFFIEKNPTLVTFPVKNLDLKEALPVPTGGNDSARR